MKSKNRNIRIRFIYALLVLLVIAIGILSRKMNGVPLLFGDILYAVMMFLIIKFLLPGLNYMKAALVSLSVCYVIEISQLYTAPWINQIRNTTLGALVLGRGFLWSDIAAYTVGTAIGVFTFYILRRLNPGLVIS